MKLKIDKESDALYLRLDETEIVESEEVQPGIILDYDADSRVVAIELLRISERLTPEQLQSFVLETNVTG